MDFWGNRSFVVATMHQKEQVIGPILHQAFGLTCVPLSDFNSDQFGTFAGEIPRKDAPLETAKKKCQLAFDLTGIDLVIASEGSFGPHPSFPFVSANEELLLLKDYKHHLEIAVRSISTQTNFASLTVLPETAIDSFLEKVQFPSHHLMLKADFQNSQVIQKGINCREDLEKLLKFYFKSTGSIVLEADMRAMNNPTRMQHIESLSRLLVDKMMKTCPNCGVPGFSISGRISGKLCEQCLRPTKGILKEIYECQTCKHNLLVDLPLENEFEDPMYCDFCNP